MKITIANKNKKDLFVAIFQVLKNCTSLVNVIFEIDRLHIQGMDKSHVCLFDVNIKQKWFDDVVAVVLYLLYSAGTVGDIGEQKQIVTR